MLNFYKKYQSPINIFLLVILPILVFYNSLHGFFLIFDDFDSAIHVKRSIFNIFMTNNFGGNFGGSYRPLEILSHMFDISIYGDANTFGRHLTNLALHIFNILLVYKLCSELTKKKLIGLIAGLIFAVHFIHSYSFPPVSWITGRVDLIVTLFYLIALILFMKFLDKGKRVYFLLSILVFFLALLSKEMAVTLPLIILLFLILFPPLKEKHVFRFKSFFPLFRTLIAGGVILITIGIVFSPQFIADHLAINAVYKQATVVKTNYLRIILVAGGGFLTILSSIILIYSKLSEKVVLRFLEKVPKFFSQISYTIPYFLTLFFYLIIRLIILKGAGGTYGNISFNLGLDTFARDIYAFAGLIYPVGSEYNNDIFYLQIEHNFTFYFVSALVLLVFIFILYRLIKTQSKKLIFFYLWIFITAIPLHNIVIPLHQFQQRYLYLPLVGFCIFISILSNKLMQKRNVFIFHRIYRILIPGVVTVVIVLSSLLIYNYNKELVKSGKIMHDFVSDMRKYQSQITGKENLFFITFPMDPMSSSSAVFAYDGYIHYLLNYTYKDYEKPYDWNILMYVKEEKSNIILKWTDERNFTLDGIDINKCFLIPNKMSYIDKQRQKIYGGILPHPFIKSFSSKGESIICSMNPDDTNKVGIVKIVEMDKDTKDAKLDVELKNSKVSLKRNSLFFMYEQGHFKLVKEFYAG